MSDKRESWKDENREFLAVGRGATATTADYADTRCGCGAWPGEKHTDDCAVYARNRAGTPGVVTDEWLARVHEARRVVGDFLDDSAQAHLVSQDLRNAIVVLASDAHVRYAPKYPQPDGVSPEPDRHPSAQDLGLRGGVDDSCVHGRSAWSCPLCDARQLAELVALWGRDTAAEARRRRQVRIVWPELAERLDDLLDQQDGGSETTELSGLIHDALQTVIEAATELAAANPRDLGVADLNEAKRKLIRARAIADGCAS